MSVGAIALNSRKLLRSLIGKKLLQVQRYIFVSDYEFYDPEIRDQESDGPTEFRTEDGMVFHVVSNTKQLAIEFIPGPCPRYGESYVGLDVTSNAFWSIRTNKSIEHIDALQSLYSPEGSPYAFGSEFFFHGVESFVVEYLSDEEHQDQTKDNRAICGPALPKNCHRLAFDGEEVAPWWFRRDAEQDDVSWRIWRKSN